MFDDEKLKELPSPDVFVDEESILFALHTLSLGIHVLPHGMPSAQCLAVVDTDEIDELPTPDDLDDEEFVEPNPIRHSLSLDIQLLPHNLPFLQFLAATLLAVASIKIKTKNERFIAVVQEVSKRISFLCFSARTNNENLQQTASSIRLDWLRTFSKPFF